MILEEVEEVIPYYEILAIGSGRRYSYFSPIMCLGDLSFVERLERNFEIWHVNRNVKSFLYGRDEEIVYLSE